MSFVRARFCELAAEVSPSGKGEQYLLGMFSLLPAMLRVPMADLAHMLPLRESIRGALMGATSVESSMLHWVEFHECADWTSCDAIAQAYGLSQNKLIQCYTDAVIWADAALHFAR